MTGGPIGYYSANPATAGKVFPNFHVGGTNNTMEEGLGVLASLDTDGTWELRFKAPEVVPVGTAKLQLIALANATTGVAKVNPKWVSVAAEENPDTATRNAEGASNLTWGAGDADVYKELKITLDGDTITASEIVVLDLVFETASWTLAQTSTWQAFIVWE